MDQNATIQVVAALSLALWFAWGAYAWRKDSQSGFMRVVEAVFFGGIMAAVTIIVFVIAAILICASFGYH